MSGSCVNARSVFSATCDTFDLLQGVNECTPFAGEALIQHWRFRHLFGEPILSLDRSASKWAVVAALAAGSLFAAASASAEVSWSIGGYQQAPMWGAGAGLSFRLRKNFDVVAAGRWCQARRIAICLSIGRQTPKKVEITAQETR